MVKRRKTMTALDDYLARLAARRQKKNRGERVDLSIRKPRREKSTQGTRASTETRRIILEALGHLGTPEALTIARSVAVGLVEIREVQ